jgi:hypothetical protein
VPEGAAGGVMDLNPIWMLVPWETFSAVPALHKPSGSAVHKNYRAYQKQETPQQNTIIKQFVI